MSRSGPEDAGVQALVAGREQIGATFRTGHLRTDEQITATATARWQHAKTPPIARQLGEGWCQ
ncbi:hypothetical protein ABN028_09680 [Actinopolymorpha sp. B17G11]|uniref:hypothetical protein n=1 Tax=Actinopolymorpha sp. B17G11 TaxID=3160861 RepID=UPI0032E4A106